MPTTSQPTPMPRDNGVVVFHPTPHESADLAAELTTALTMRMKPPPEPPSDLRISTGAWLALSAIGLSLWMLSMMRLNDEPARQLLQIVGGIGGLELVISYMWVAYIGARRNTQRGVEALFPPVWLYRLVNPCENTPGYRPLRFAVAGTVLAAMALLGGTLRPVVQNFTGDPEPQIVIIPKPHNSPMSRLADAEKEGINLQLTEALLELAKDKATFNATPAETSQLIAELRRLRTHENGEVRGAALIALKKWAGLEAVKPEVLALLRKRNAETHERRSALEVAREFKDREVARAVAQCIRYSDLFEDAGSRAKDTLRAIGPPEAEDALLELFEDEDLHLKGLPALLAELGGPKSITQLHKLAADESKPKDVRDEAKKTADKIAARLGGEKKND